MQKHQLNPASRPRSIDCLEIGKHRFKIVIPVHKDHLNFLRPFEVIGGAEPVVCEMT